VKAATDGYVVVPMRRYPTIPFRATRESLMKVIDHLERTHLTEFSLELPLIPSTTEIRLCCGERSFYFEVDAKVAPITKTPKGRGPALGGEAKPSQK
jgi:hypothetical protein